MPQPPQDDPSTAAVPPAVSRARDVPTLLEALVEADPGRPRLTWYGAGGERVELSARVLVNWVAKTVDLLANELDVEPGDVVELALPAGWRTAVIALAAWCVGAEPSWDGDEGEMLDDLEPQPPAVLVTTADGPVGPAGRVVVVDLPALSRRTEGGPPGALDFNAEVTGRDDVLDVDEQAQDRRVLELADDLARICEWRPGERVLGLAEDLGPDLVLGALRRDGSVVAVAHDAGLDLDDLAGQEQATARA